MKDFQTFDPLSGQPISGIILCTTNIVFAERGVNETKKGHSTWHVLHHELFRYMQHQVMDEINSILEVKEESNINTFVPDRINVIFNNSLRRLYVCDDSGICIKKPKLKR